MSRLKKKAKNRLGKFLLILILIGCGIGGYYLYKNIYLKGKDKKDEDIVEKVPIKEEEKKLKIVDINSTSRPYAVMINNINKARPFQSGLQDAYIIYEIIVEGGISRFMALFLDQNTERIGSIRSSRHYFLDYALENDAIYVHHGQSPQAQSDFRKLNIDRIAVTENKTGWRDKSLRTSREHTLFTSIDKLGLESKKRTERNGNLLLNYSIDEIDLSLYEGAIKADQVIINYSNSVKNSYIYNNDTKTYLRSVNGQNHIDYVTKRQYDFKNIIVYQVENYLLNDSEHKGRQGIRNIGSGTGYYISDGYAIKINWQKDSRNKKTIYTLENGDELKVNDGNTFIQIQPEGQLLQIS